LWSARPAAKLTSVNLIRGTISPPWRIRTIPRTFPGCSTRTTRPIPGANCVCVRVFPRLGDGAGHSHPPLPAVSNL
jgi:hypothetical protein